MEICAVLNLYLVNSHDWGEAETRENVTPKFQMRSIVFFFPGANSLVIWVVFNHVRF